MVSLSSEILICRNKLAELAGGRSLRALVGNNNNTHKNARKLIINTGDISDADGFFALAKYATSGADVLFVMNYPAFLRVNSPASANGGLNEFGLGYTYSEQEYYKASDALLCRLSMSAYTDYRRIKCKYYSVKQCFTDLGFAMAMKVWNSFECIDKGNLYFCVGGVNDVNPFHKKALKNEIYVYRDIGRNMQRLGTCKPMDVFDTKGNPVILAAILGGCESIYIDFNGSMAFLDSAWRTRLGEVKRKIKGLFVMGGVYTDVPPTTMPPIKDVLNRMSCSTMNQFYAPEKSCFCFQLMKAWSVPIFMIANNVVTLLADNEKLRDFLISNKVFSDDLFKIACYFYDSHYKPGRKPFDFYVALALVEYMNGGERPFGSVCNLCINPEYGITLITNQENCEDTVKEYTGKWDNHITDQDNASNANKKKNFACEQAVLSMVKCDLIRYVYKVEFNLSEQSVLSIIY